MRSAAHFAAFLSLCLMQLRIPLPLLRLLPMGGSPSKQSKCLVVGLDNSGKSTIINHLKPDTKKVRALQLRARSDSVDTPLSECDRKAIRKGDALCGCSDAMARTLVLASAVPVPSLLVSAAATQFARAILFCSLAVFAFVRRLSWWRRLVSSSRNSNMAM